MMRMTCQNDADDSHPHDFDSQNHEDACQNHEDDGSQYLRSHIIVPQ